MAAKLQHPHIVPLLSAGEEGETLYYTMPFVEGESLRTRLQREGELPIPDVVRVLREVAGALAYAHRRGIVHRDIKPENVLLSDGNSLVTDFGIAKALEVARTQGDEKSGTISQLGVALGTPAYMAPEQGAADPTVDHRADLYALGCVGYELLSGRPPFEGRATRQLMAAHATETPAAIGVRRANTPPELATLVMQCLEKSAADRPQSAEEILRTLDGLARTPVGTTSRTASASARRGVGVKASKMLAASLLVAAGIATGVLAARWRAAPVANLAVYDVGLSEGAPILLPSLFSTVSIAPHGDFVVYVTQTPGGVSQLRYRSLVDTVERLIPATEDGTSPQIAPDGESVAFIRSPKDGDRRVRPRLEITGLRGGTPRPLADLRNPTTIRWVSPTRLFVIDDNGTALQWFDPQGGAIGSAVSIKQCLAPSSPDNGKSLLCGGGNRKYATITGVGARTERILWRPAGSGSGVAQPVIGSHFRVVDARYIVFVSIDGELRAARFDSVSLQVGRPITMVTGVHRGAFQNLGRYDIAANGTLTYALGDNAEVGHMMVVRPRSSAPEPIRFLPEAAAFQRFDLSPDGRRLAAVVQGRESQELRIFDVDEGRSQTWLRSLYIGHPLWSPRGERIAVDMSAESTSVLVIGSPDAATAPDTLVRTSGANPAPGPMSWRSDSVLIASGELGHVLSLDPRMRAPRVDTVMRDANFPDLSPDGRFLVFARLGKLETRVTPFPARDAISQLDEGLEAHWVSMSTIRYRGAYSWQEVSVDSATGRLRGTPRPYFSDPRFSDTPGWSQRTVSDGGMLYVQGPARTTAAYLRVVPNWVARMKRAVDSADAIAR